MNELDILKKDKKRGCFCKHFFHLRLLLILLFCFFSFPSIGQEGYKYVIRNYTSENGLPQNSIRDILFDKAGFCWLATEGGLVRFDNRNFKVFNHQNVKGQKSDRIFIMRTSTSQEIYAETRNGQYLKIMQDQAHDASRAKIEDNDTCYNPYMGYRSLNGRVQEVYDSLRRLPESPKVYYPRLFTSPGNGDIYLRFVHQLYYITGKNDREINENAEIPLYSAPLGKDLFVELQKDNQIYVWKNGVRLPQKNLAGDIAINKADISYDYATTNLLWCPNGTFLYTKNSLYQLEFKNGIVTTRMLLQGLPFSVPLCINYDIATRTFYFGTGSQGLYVVKLSDFTYPEIPASVGEPVFYALAKTSDNTVISKNVIIPYKGRNPYKVTLNNDNCMATYVDEQDRMYYESEFVLCRYSMLQRRIDTICPLDNRLVAIFPYGHNEGLLVSTTTTIFLLSSKDSIIWKKTLPTECTGVSSLENNIYLLTTPNGVKWYDLDRNVITHSILDSLYTRTVFVKNKNQLWIGTDGNGPFLYDAHKIYALPAGTKNALDNIHAFIPDGSGFFWLPTNNGLFRVNINDFTDYVLGKRRDIYIYKLNKKDGLHTNEFNGGASPQYLWLGDSTLVLPSINGMVEFKPKELRISYPDKPIYIDEIILDRSKTLSLDRNKGIELQPDFKTLNIKVSCPYFGNTENLQLEYSIQNTKNGQWIRVPNDGYIFINTLPSGSYKIVVKKEGLNDENNSSLVIAINVLPHFYNTWWSYCLVLLCIALFVFAFLKIRTKQLKKENVRIERLVQLRTHELAKTIVLLEQSELSLKKSNDVKDRIVSMVMHDLRSPIEFLNIISKHIVSQFNQLDKTYIISKLKDLNTSLSTLKGFIEQFFSWALSQKEDFQVENTTFALQEVFDDVESLYTEIIAVNNNSFLIKASELICDTDKHILTLIIRNLVDNANKNTRNGVIALNSYKENDKLHIQVSDNGKGLTDAEIKRFVDSSRGTERSGTGSILILSMLQKIGGTLGVVSECEKGSVFTVSIQDNYTPDTNI